MNFVAELTTMSAPHSIGPTQRGRCAGVVDHQRQPVLVRDLGQLLDVGDVELGIAQRLGVTALVFGVDGLAQCRRSRRHRQTSP